MSRSRALAVGTATVIAFSFFVAMTKAQLDRTRKKTSSAPVYSQVAHGDIATDSTSERDEEAIAALDRMGNYLRTLKAFQLKADVVTEDVRTDGQKVQIIRNVDLVAQRPDRLFARVKNDRQDRLFFFDGKNFTLYAPRPNFYATISEPGTLEKLADDLEDNYGLELPLVDLFRWGTPEADASSITGAVDLGPSAINGVTCEQYGFRQDGADWQLWIQRGEQPLPCRIVITTLTDDARPQHTATYSWNLAPSYDENTFVFRAPGDAKPIPLAHVVASAPAADKQ